jgi:hypothetical protein
MRDLPWHEELKINDGQLPESTMYDVTSAEGAGSHGFSFECEVAGIKVEDKCTAESFTNYVDSAIGGVEWYGPVTKFNCTARGKEAGVIEKTGLLEATKGAALEANIVEGTFSKLTSEKAAKGSGSLTMEMNKEEGHDAAGLSCAAALEGAVGPGIKGK